MTPLFSAAFGVQSLDPVTPDVAAQIRHAGVQVVRFFLSWSQVQPTAGAPLDWSQPDRSLANLAAAGLGVLLVPCDHPAWAGSDPAGPVNAGAQGAYDTWLAAAGARYSGAGYSLVGWEISNEPDARTSFGYRAADYVTFLCHNRSILKARAPALPVVMGGIGYDNFVDNGGDFVRGFFAGFLASGGATCTDAINFHHYSRGGSWPGVSAMLGSIRGLLANAQVDLPVIWTETGAPSEASRGGSEETQAVYLAQTYTWAVSNGVRAITWFPWQDPAGQNGASYFGTHGLLRQDGTAKPALTAYQAATTYLLGAQPLRAQSPAEWSAGADAEGYSFRRPDGTGLVVAWTHSGTATEAWPADWVAGVRDIYGRPVAYSQANGLAIIPLAVSPIYILLPVPARYSDEGLDDWWQAPVEALSDAGAISGYADGTFQPGGATTRGQLAKILVVLAGWPLVSGGPHFADVPASHPFYSYLETAYAHHVVSGYADGTFRPGANVTRGQMARLLVGAAGWPLVSPTHPHFADVPPVHPFYAAIETAVAHGIIGGYADGTFRPGSSATRAQTAKIAYLAISPP